MSCSKIFNIHNNKYQINNHQINNNLTNDDYETESDSDGSIDDDDIEDLELDWLGILIQGEYIIVKYIGRGTFSRVWLSYHFKSQQFYILKIYFQDCEEEFECEIKIYDKNGGKYLCSIGDIRYLDYPYLIDKYGKSLVDHEDNFNLYIKIAKNVTSAIPKKQLTKNIFKEFLVQRKKINKTTFIFKY